MDVRILDLIATVVECCEERCLPGLGHPPAETVRVLATLRQFLREDTPWHSLAAGAGEASGSTLRRRLEVWTRDSVLAQVHALLVAMLRGNPILILDSCSVWAKRAGKLAGPNPTDRGKKGTKYHVAVTGDGVPVACVATAATSMTPWSLSACSWRPSPSWSVLQPCSPTRDTTPSTTASCAALSAPSRTSTNSGSRAVQGWASPVAGGAQQCLVAGEQAPRVALRPARLYCAKPAPDRLHTPGCRQARSGIVKTAF